MPKPVKKKKRFITKKESTTFKLIPGFVEDDEDQAAKNETPEDIASRKEEERKYGVFYDDDYNYMKHLRSLNEAATMVNTEAYSVQADDETRSVASGPPLFFEMFSTDVEEGESIDPEILAALDEAPLVVSGTGEDDMQSEAVGGSTGLESFLDDDFISQAGGPAPKPEPDEDDEEWSDEDEEEDEESDFDVSDDEDFTSQSVADSQAGEGRGTRQDDIAEAQTALILRNFEEGLGFGFSTQEIDNESEAGGEVDYEMLKHMLAQDSKKQEPVTWSQVLDDKEDKPKIDPLKYQYEDEDEFMWKEAPRGKPQFDCVSILSLNSNTRNRPTDILPPSSKPRKAGKGNQDNAAEGGVGPDKGLSLRQLEQEMRESRRAEQADRASTFRPQGETAEEKKARKKAIKDERKERRHEKKANKLVFSLESEKMKRETAALSKSVKSVKIS